MFKILTAYNAKDNSIYNCYNTVKEASIANECTPTAIQFAIKHNTVCKYLYWKYEQIPKKDIINCIKQIKLY